MGQGSLAISWDKVSVSEWELDTLSLLMILNRIAHWTTYPQNNIRRYRYHKKVNNK